MLGGARRSHKEAGEARRTGLHFSQVKRRIKEHLSLEKAMKTSQNHLQVLFDSLANLALPSRNCKPARFAVSGRENKLSKESKSTWRWFWHVFVVFSRLECSLIILWTCEKCKLVINRTPVREGRSLVAF